MVFTTELKLQLARWLPLKMSPENGRRKRVVGPICASGQLGTISFFNE
jgi:hypothetical protein